jgi:TusA-related sulfurtransferase
LEQETGSCADLGVWNGAVGAVGLLAARAALDLLAGPSEPGRGYLVLDLESGRHMALGAAPDPACPVCARRGAVEPYPDDVACAAPDEAPVAADPEPREALDLRTERCPLNLLRARRALDAMAAGAEIEIHLGAEGAATVPDGVRALGHAVVASEPRGDGLFLRVRAGGRAAPGDGARLDERALQRFARQVVLPEVGEEGQRALLDASVLLAGSGAAFEIAKLYLEAAGVACVTAEDARHDLVAWAGDRSAPGPALQASDRPALVLSASDGSIAIRADWSAPLVATDGAADAVLGALLADAVQRHLVTGRTPLAGVALDGLLRGTA